MSSMCISDSARRLGWVMGLTLWPSMAQAGALTDDLAAAQKALVEKDATTALASVASAEGAAADLETVARATIITRVHYYRGMAIYMNGDQESAMNEWRTALMIDNSLKWDEGIAKDQQAQDLFEALRKEVRDRPTVDAGVPPLLGLAKLYVDGERVCPSDRVQEGTHLIQVECPEDRVYGAWVTFPKKKVKWLKLCPNGVDTSLIPEPEEEQEEDMFSFGDDMDDEPAGCPLPGEAGDEAAADDSAPGATPTANAPLIEHRVSWPMVAAGTGLLVGGGAALAIASSRKAAFMDASFTSAAEVDTAAQKVNNVAWVGTGLTVVGGGLCVAAVIPW